MTKIWSYHVASCLSKFWQYAKQVLPLAGQNEELIDEMSTVSNLIYWLGTYSVILAVADNVKLSKSKKEDPVQGPRH